MQEYRGDQLHPVEEVKLPLEKLKPIVTELQKKFKDAFEKSRELPLWQQAPASSSLDAYVSEYISEKERWRVSPGSDSLSITRHIRTEKGIEIDEIDLMNDERSTWLYYDKVIPDKHDPNKRQKSHTGNTPLAVEMMEKLISELPQYQS